MTMIVDRAVEDVLAFMQAHVEADRLIAVSEAVAGIASLIWGKYPRRNVDALSFNNGQIIGNEISRRAANGCGLEPPYVGDGFATVMDADAQM
jgi:hypothetical protein